MPRLSRHRFSRAGNTTQQAVVLHVAGADLDDVGGILDGVGSLGVHELGDDGDSRTLASPAENVQTLKPQALERIRTGSRLERPAQEPDSPFHQPVGRAKSIVSFSTEQGPAMITRPGPPIVP